MLNYGSAAQEYFLNESGSDLANYDLDTDYKKVDEVAANTINKPYDATGTLLPKDVAFEGVTLSLRSETTLSFYFKSENEMTFDGCDNFETSSNYDADVERTGDYWVFRIRDISAKELDDRILLLIRQAAT